MAPRYKKEDTDWLLEQVDNLKANGTTVVDAAELLADDWHKRTGVEIQGRSLAGLYHNHKAKHKAAGNIDTMADLEGCSIVVAEKGSQYASVYPDIDTALESVRGKGKLENYEFWKAKPIHVGYETRVVVKG